jgi:hypothetical protein
MFVERRLSQTRLEMVLGGIGGSSANTMAAVVAASIGRVSCKAMYNKSA